MKAIVQSSATSMTYLQVIQPVLTLGLLLLGRFTLASSLSGLPSGGARAGRPSSFHRSIVCLCPFG